MVFGHACSWWKSGPVTSKSGSRCGSHLEQASSAPPIDCNYHTAMAFLSWLSPLSCIGLSQSIFLVVINAYKYDGTPDPAAGQDRIACGYSPIAILITIVVGILVLLGGIANGFRRYPQVGIPLAASCSAAISAACHPPPGDD